MDSDILSGSVDKTQIPPLHQKRILAFVNHFVINSCSFLNDFATKCESKFIEVERKIQKVESSLIIIEAKLSSIPGLNDQGTKVEALKSKEPSEPVPEQKQSGADNATDEHDIAEPTPAEEPAPVETGVKACEDARYVKFFKMLQFGVPANAVKVKMQSEGVDPNILDTPNLILADGIPR